MHASPIASPSAARNVSSGSIRSDQQIIREPLFGDGERFILPLRQLGDATKYGWVAVGFGIFTTLFMVGWIGGPLSIGVGMLVQGKLFGFLLVAFSFLGIIGLKLAILLTVGGWAVVRDRSRSVVEIKGEKLIVHEKFYWLTHRRKCKLNRIEQLKFTRKWDDKSDGSSEAIFDVLGGVLVATDEEEQFLVAVGYPAEVLLELADGLASQLNDTSYVHDTLASQDNVREKTPVEVVEVGPDDIEPIEKPEDSDLVLQRHDAGIKIELPATGFKSFIGLFSVVWLVICTALLALLVGGEANEPAWVGWLIAGIFEVVGIAMFLWAFNTGRRRTSIVTAGDRLLVVSESPFRKTRHEWSKDQLHEIRVGDSNVSVNDEPIQELQFHDNVGKKFGCLSERDDKELLWIAYELNAALAMEPATRRRVILATVARDQAGHIMPSAGSNISMEYLPADGALIEVPGRGLRKFVSLLVNGVIGIVLGVGVSALFIWYEADVFEVIIPVTFGAFFALSGFGCIVLSVVLGRRGFSFEVHRDRLHVQRTGWLSQKELQWRRDELRSVAVEDSGTKINNRGILHLKIRGFDTGHAFNGMTDHSLEDLSLVVTAINEVMSLDSDSDTLTAESW